MESEKGEPIKPTQVPTSVVVILPVATAADKHSVSPSPSPTPIYTAVPIPTVTPVKIREIFKSEIEVKTLQEKTFDSVSKID